MKTRNQKITIRAAQDERTAWAEEAERRGLTLSQLVRRVLNAVAAGKIKRIPAVGREDADPSNR